MPSRKGIPNKPKRALIALLDEKFPGWNTVVQMAEIANDETLEPIERFNAAKEVAQYVTPKLRSIDLTVEDLTDYESLPTLKLLERFRELTDTESES